jgi:hypothetical protein
MELQSITPTKKSYKVRRYKCPICDFEKTEFGTGYKETMIDPILNDQAVNKMYRQQERNNERD